MMLEKQELMEKLSVIEWRQEGKSEAEIKRLLEALRRRQARERGNYFLALNFTGFLLIVTITVIYYAQASSWARASFPMVLSVAWGVAFVVHFLVWRNRR